MLSRGVRFRLLVSSAFILSIVEPASAQTSPGNIVDPGQVIDDNGVDLLTGKYRVSVASAATRNLKFEAGWSGPVDSSIINSRLIVSGSEIFVTISGSTVKFTKVGSSYIEAAANGGSLVRTQANTGFIYRTKSGDSAYFEDEPSNAAGNSAGLTSAYLDHLSFADPVRADIQFYYKTVLSGGLTYRRVSQMAIGDPYGGGGDVLKPNYTSDIATNANFKKLAGVKAFYQGPPSMQQPCWHGDDACPLVDAREELGISSTTSGGTETISITDKGGRVTVVKRGANGITSIRKPGDASDGIVVSYDGAGQVSSLTRYGQTYTYVFGSSGGNRTATVTQAAVGSRFFIIDTVKRKLLSERNEELETRSFDYDSSGRLTRVTHPEGNYEAYTYDARSNLTQIDAVPKPGSGDAVLSATWGFPAGCTSAVVTCNQATWSRDPKGTQTDYLNGLIVDNAYIDEIRFPAAVAGGDRLVVRNNYTNVFGNVMEDSGQVPSEVMSTELTAVDTLKVVAGNFSSPIYLKSKAFGFDDDNGSHELLPRSWSEVSLSGVYTSRLGEIRSYDSKGLLTSLRPLNHQFVYFYDSIRRLVGEISPDVDGAGPITFKARRLIYNSRGLIEKVEIGTATAQTQAALAAMTVLSVSENSYDANRRLVKVEQRAGGNVISVLQFSYNAQGLQECSAQRMNPVVFTALPTSACTLGTVGSFGPDRITKNHYDAAGRLLRTQQAFGTADVIDEVAVTYNDNGTVASVTDASGNRTSYEYDGHDRLKKTIFPHKTIPGSSDPSNYEQYWYDLNGNIVQKRLRDGNSIYYSYDLLDRVTLIDLPGAESDIGYTYDLEGRMKTATRGGITNNIAYDPLGRMIGESSNVGNVQFEYDGLDRLAKMTWPDGFFVTYEYQDVGPLKAIKENGSTALATYGYDSQGRRVSVAFGNGATQVYAYDAASRPISITHDLAGTTNDHAIGLAYNPASQIISRTGSNSAYEFNGYASVNRTYTANGLNQYTSSGSVNLGYDARGNLISSGTDTYGYSSDNLLVSGPGGATLTYDGRGMLFETSKAGATTRMLYAGSALVGEYSASNLLQRRFIPGIGADETVVWYEGAGTANKRYLLSDERRSITTITAGAAALFGVNRYDEYGIPGATNIGRFQYTGQAWLPEIGMYHYKARTYSPTLGRFLQTDPIEYGDGMNLYSYVGNDPINRTDPSGMYEISAPDVTVTGTRPSDCERQGYICLTGSNPSDEYDADRSRYQAQRVQAPTYGKVKNLPLKIARMKAKDYIKEIQRCSPPGSQKCKDLWKKYMDFLDSAEGRFLRAEANDRHVEAFSCAIGIASGMLSGARGLISVAAGKGVAGCAVSAILVTILTGGSDPLND